MTPNVLLRPARFRDEFHEVRRQRFWLVPRAFLIGLLVGGLVTGFRFLVDAVEFTQGWLVVQSQERGLAAWAVYGTLTFLLLVVAVESVARFCPEASGAGVPYLKLALLGLKPLHRLRLLVVKFLSALAAMAAGLAIGPEGPAVKMGAVVALAPARWMGPKHGRQFASCGAAAGLSAIFDAPLAGIFFAVEELRAGAGAAGLLACLISSLTANLVAQLRFGHAPLYDLPMNAVPTLDLIPHFLLLGVLCALLGDLFNRGMLFMVKELYHRSAWVRLTKIGTMAAVLVGLAMLWPDVLGEGIALTNRIVANTADFRWLLGVLVVRLLLMLGSCGLNTAAGIYAPLFVLGAAVGRLHGQVGEQLGLTQPGESAIFAAVGMGAIMAGVFRCPFTALVLIIEVTKNYSLVLPLMTANVAAVLVADALGSLPIYDALAERALGEGVQVSPRAGGTPGAKGMNDSTPLVGIIMGSRTDWETMQHAASTLDRLEVPYEIRVVSAHRTPDLLFKYAETAAGRGLEVIIAGAGGAAHLPGMTAAKTSLPVLGVPVQSKTLSGLDSLLSIVQMPAGVPVGTLAIGQAGAANAALLAVSILANKHPEIRDALNRFRQQQTEIVLEHPDPRSEPGS